MFDDQSDPHEANANPDFSALRPLTEKKKHWLSTTCLTAAAYDDPELIAECPKGERNGAIARGALLMFYVAFLAMCFAIIGHNLLHSSFDPAIILGAIFLAAFLGLIDHYVMLRTAMFPDGMKGLRHGGFPVDVPIGAGLSSKFCKRLRIALSLALGGVTALFIGLALNSSAVDSRVTELHFAKNKAGVQRATQDFDARRSRAAKAYEDAQTAATRLIKLSSRKTWKPGVDDARLATQQASLDEKKQALDALDAGRPHEIEEGLRKTPGYVPMDDSLMARLRELFHAMHDDPWVAIVIGIFDAVLIGVDAVILTLKAIAMPSTYSMRDTRRHLGEMVRQAKLARAETGAEPLPAQLPPAEDGGQIAVERRGPGRRKGSKNKPKTPETNKHLNGSALVAEGEAQ